MSRKSFFLTVFLSLIVFSSLFSTSRIEEHEYDFQKIKNLYLSSSFGEITVDTWQKSYAHLRIEKWVEGIGDHEKFLDELKLVEIYAGNTLRLEQKIPENRVFFKSFGVKITMYVPESYGEYFEIKNSFGNIQVTGLKSKTSVSNSSGEIEVGDIDSDVIAGNSFGSVRIENIRGNVQISNSSGEINASNVDGDIYVKNSFGKVNIRKIGGKVEVESSSNPITVEDAGNGVNVKNSFGEIILRSVAGNIHAKSSNGRISVEMKKNFGESYLTGELETSFGDVYLDGFTGDMSIKSSSGKIDVKNFDGVLNVKNSFGGINIINCNLRNGNHSVETSSGEINAAVKFPESGKAKFITSFDDIRLSVAKEESFCLTAKTSFGDVKIRNLSVMENEDGKRFVNGGGDFMLDLKTSSGDVVVSGE